MIEIQGKEFEIGRLNARQQFHIARRIAPVIVSLVDDGGFNVEKAAEAMAELKDDDADYIFNTCLSVVKYKDEDNGGRLFPVCVNGNVMFDWVDLSYILPLCMNVIQENLGNFMQGQSRDGRAQKQTA